MAPHRKSAGRPTSRDIQPADAGRPRQRARTRAQLVAVTARLLQAGETPSVTDIARAAGVARRTVYLHFPTLEHLLIDAQLGLLSEASVEAAIDAADAGGDVEARVLAMVDAIGTLASRTLPMGRSLLRLTVERPAVTAAGVPTRGYRRVAWIERALAPLRGTLPGTEFEQLVSSLAVVIGWEALIVLEDVRGLSAPAALETARWLARTVVRGALARHIPPVPGAA